MTAVNNSLTNIWVDDGHGNLIPVTPSSSVGSSQLPDDVLKFYEDAGVDAIAREAGIIEDEEVVATTITNRAPPLQGNPRTIKLIAVPISSTKQQQQVSVNSGLPRAIRLNTTSQQVVNASPLVFAGASNTTVLPHASHSVTPKVIQLIQAPHGHTAANVPTNPTWASASARKRTNEGLDSYASDSKRRKGEKSGGKGLRHFSMKVCEKVEKKGVTTYNEVADELVSELSDLQGGLSDFMGQQFDQKNIRRRVYDALNVLMAMNIISKEKKEIRWIGLPTNTAQECQGLEVERRKRLERIQQKTQQLQELILQQIAFKNLVERNRRVERDNGVPDPGSVIRLPFIVVNTSKSTVIDCSISDDKSEYLFSFDRTFEIHDDIEVLKRMGLSFGLEKGHCTTGDMAQAVKMVPKSLEPYVREMALGKSMSKPGIMVKTEPSYSNMNASENFFQMEPDIDSEVTMVTGNSPESSFDSYSDIQSSTIQDFSDDSESNL